MFVVDSPPKQLSVQDHLISLLEDGTIAIWDLSLNAKIPQGKIELNVQDAANLSKFHTVHANEDGISIYVSYGSLLQPKTERIYFVDANNQIKSSVLLNRFVQENKEPNQKVSKCIN